MPDTKGTAPLLALQMIVPVILQCKDCLIHSPLLLPSYSHKKPCIIFTECSNILYYLTWINIPRNLVENIWQFGKFSPGRCQNCLHFLNSVNGDVNIAVYACFALHSLADEREGKKWGGAAGGSQVDQESELLPPPGFPTGRNGDKGNWRG